MNDDREHKVRERAYALWESEGRPSGRHDAHWHQAHSEVTAVSPSQTPDQPEAAAPAAKRAASSRKPVAASPTAADTPAAVEQAAPAPRKKRAVKPKA